jgi:hypothetical protein
MQSLEARVAQCRTSALFDTAGFTRGLEAALAAAVGRHRDGLPPDHIDIARGPTATLRR